MLMVYFIAGIVVNRFRGQSGMRLLPHGRFWSELFSLAKGGCRYSICLPTKEAGEWRVKKVFADYEAL